MKKSNIIDGGKGALFHALSIEFDILYSGELSEIFADDKNERTTST